MEGVGSYPVCDGLYFFLRRVPKEAERSETAVLHEQCFVKKLSALLKKDLRAFSGKFVRDQKMEDAKRVFDWDGRVVFVG